MRSAIRFALANENLVTEVIDGQQFPALVREYQVFAVPKTVINDEVSFDGAGPDENLMGLIESVTVAKNSEGS